MQNKPSRQNIYDKAKGVLVKMGNIMDKPVMYI